NNEDDGSPRDKTRQLRLSSSCLPPFVKQLNFQYLSVRAPRFRVLFARRLTPAKDGARISLKTRWCGISRGAGNTAEGQSERGLICTDAALGRRYYTLDPMREAKRAKNLARAPRGRSVSPLPIALQQQRTLPLLQVITLTSAVAL